MPWTTPRFTGPRSALYSILARSLERLVEDNAHEQKKIIFDPIPRVDGIEPSADPLLELQAAAPNGER